ncbi:MAG: glycosyltransferase family 2 protein [Halobacteriota archaeon]
MKISVVIPTMDEPAIQDVLDEVFDAMRDQNIEVIVVDKSEDETATRAAQKGARVIHQAGKGYGDAYITGFKHVSEDTDVVVILDGDKTYDPYDIPALIAILNEGADLVIGNRLQLMDKEAMSKRNAFGNRMLTALLRSLYHVPINDSQSGMRAIKLSALNRLTLQSAHMPFASEMIIEAQKAGLNIAETPIKYRKRVGHPKLDPFKDAFSIVFMTIRLVRDYNPIVIFLPIGLVLFLVGIGYGAGILLEYIHTGIVTRFAGSILSVLLILTGVQIMLFGLLADIILTNLRRR